MSDLSLNYQELVDKLNASLDLVLSPERTSDAIATGLVGLARVEQDFVIKWTSIVSNNNAELGFQFALKAPVALELMSLDDTHDWLIHSMDLYDKSGLYPAVKMIRDVDQFALEAKSRARGVMFEDVVGVLEKFVTGLTGRQLSLEVGDHTYTDTSTLFLPNQIFLFPDKEKNYRLLKAIVVQLWAQTWYGTFHVDPLEALAEYEDTDKATAWFLYLETLRLNARIKKDLPGLYRDMMGLLDKRPPLDSASEMISKEKKILSKPKATVSHTYQAIVRLYKHPVPAGFCYQTEMNLLQVQKVMSARSKNEKQELNELLAKYLADKDAIEDKLEEETGVVNKAQFELKQITDNQDTGDFSFEVTLDGKPMPRSDVINNLLSSILQDLGEIPPEYLVAAGDGGYQRQAEGASGKLTRSADADVIFYDEWDYRRQQYRKNWCWLKEKPIHPSHDHFVEKTVKKYSSLLMDIRKTFEALRGEDKLLKRQLDGDNIDMDALVEAYGDMAHGMELSERIFTRQSRIERNIAVMFMVDMSGSTKGWINDAERESLVLLCEALEILGDRYAIYGFSGLTRNRCEIYRIKRFEEPYSKIVKQRIAGISPQDYTRMGVTIRHLSKLLDEVEAKTKLLITLSDGKPDDFDGYRGNYGIEDTRKALIEAKHLGIHPFCITIDDEAHEYLPHMYGAVNYTVIDDVKKLPLKIADIYRRLTI